MRVGIVGVGQTKMGEHWSKSLRDLSTEAGALALKNAGLPASDIDGLFIGNMSAGRFVGQEHLGALAADHAGLTPIAATRCEAACASGSLAFRKAYLAILSGQHKIVMVGGSEKMTDLGATGGVGTLMGAGDQEWESSIGLTFPGVYALMAQAYIQQYGLERDELSLVPVKNHENGIKNPYAQFRFPVSVSDVAASSLVADPLRLLDCSPITDGAAAIILAAEDVAKRFEKPVWVAGSGQASDTLALHDREELCRLKASEKAAEMAYAQAGMKPDDIHVAEVHDCFSIAEIMAYEDLGFAKRGKGKQLLLNKDTSIGGVIPVNTDGGLKVGHPIGATGIKQLIEITRQLRGEAPNQVKGATVGLAHNVGGSGATALVHILRSD